MRVAIVAIIVSALCVAAQAQKAKPCPSGDICPICTEQDGVRSCKVERPGQQPELPQAAAPLDIRRGAMLRCRHLRRRPALSFASARLSSPCGRAVVAVIARREAPVVRFL
jgi:hypothetical protein